MRCKRGSGHFEMIVSFVFFVGFVFFLFMVLKPHDTSTLSSSVVGALYGSFEEEVYTNLSEVFLRTDYVGGGSCFYVELPGGIFKYAMVDGGSYVRDLDGVDVNSGLESGDLNVDSTDDFFRVAVSPDFEDEGVIGCDVLPEYELGGIVERRVVSYGALVEMKDRYYNDYDSLKVDLRIPAIFDFAIVSEGFPDVVMEPSRGVSSSSEVVARDYLMEVLYSNGTIVREVFVLSVW